MPKISAIIHTLNEEANIANAIRSVTTWVDEVIVVDMYSDDRTVEIAESHGAKVFQHERTGFVEPAREFAEQQATGDWIFVLDADEVASYPLSQTLLRIAREEKVDVCCLPRLNYFGGFPLLHSGWGPKQDLVQRFYRKGYLLHPKNVHGRPVLKEGSRIVDLSFQDGSASIHFSYINVSHVIQKLDRYTNIEAAELFEKGKKAGFREILVRPVLEFINRYVRRKGCLDGWPGFYYCVLMLFYKMTTAMKLRELNLVGDAAAVRQQYQQEAEKYITEYEQKSKFPGEQSV